MQYRIMRKIWFTFLLGLAFVHLFAQGNGNRKLVLITFDGYRWEDVFRGADSSMLFPKLKGVKDSAQYVKRFWGKDFKERREKLMPFFWNSFGLRGQVYGNRDLQSFVNVKNPYWFSYPGYNEILTGYPDTIINSNDYPANPNITLPEFINKQPGFQHKVAAFASWAAFARILNKDRSGFPVNAGYSILESRNLDEVQRFLNQQQFLLPKTFGPNERPDAVTYFLAKEYLKQEHPRFLQISFIETDAYGHQDKYQSYLESARSNDEMLKDLWEYIQSDPFYKDQTTIFIATDHGRGDKADWTHHNSKTPGSDQVWFAVMGPGIPLMGETRQQQVYQYQYAKTMARLLGIDFKSPNAIGEEIKTVLGKN